MLYGYKCCMQWIKILYTDITVYKKKQMILTKILQKMLKKDLALQNYELGCQF